MRTFWIPAIALMLSLSGCYDDGGSYGTLSEARGEAVFQRGLLPDILPPSAYDIRITSNGVSLEGEFRFDPADFSTFAAQFESLYQPFEFSVGDSAWTFICEPTNGHCFYYTR